MSNQNDPFSSTLIVWLSQTFERVTQLPGILPKSIASILTATGAPVSFSMASLRVDSICPAEKFLKLFVNIIKPFGVEIARPWREFIGVS